MLLSELEDEKIRTPMLQSEYWKKNNREDVDKYMYNACYQCIVRMNKCNVEII